MEHAEREAFLARNQSTPLEELIQNLESEILRVTYFCLDPRIREVFKKTDIAKITELIEANGSNMDDLDALRPVKGVFETYVSLLYQQDETLGIDLFASPPIGSHLSNRLQVRGGQSGKYPSQHSGAFCCRSGCLPRLFSGVDGCHIRREQDGRAGEEPYTSLRGLSNLREREVRSETRQCVRSGGVLLRLWNLLPSRHGAVSIEDRSHWFVAAGVTGSSEKRKEKKNDYYP